MLPDERPNLDPAWQRQRKDVADMARIAAAGENVGVHQMLRGHQPHELRARAVLCGQLAHLDWAPSTMDRHLGMALGSAAAALALWQRQGFGLRKMPEEAFDPEYEAWLARMKTERAKRKLRVVSNPLQQRARPAPRPPTPVPTWVDTSGNRNRLRSGDASAPTLTATIGELAGGLR